MNSGLWPSASSHTKTAYRPWTSGKGKQMFQFAQTVSPYFLSTTVLNEAFTTQHTGHKASNEHLQLETCIYINALPPMPSFSANQNENALSCNSMNWRGVSHMMKTPTLKIHTVKAFSLRLCCSWNLGKKKKVILCICSDKQFYWFTK